MPFLFACCSSVNDRLRYKDFVAAVVNYGKGGSAGVDPSASPPPPPARRPGVCVCVPWAPPPLLPFGRGPHPCTRQPPPTQVLSPSPPPSCPPPLDVIAPLPHTSPLPPPPFVPSLLGVIAPSSPSLSSVPMPMPRVPTSTCPCPALTPATPSPPNSRSRSHSHHCPGRSTLRPRGGTPSGSGPSARVSGAGPQRPLGGGGRGPAPAPNPRAGGAGCCRGAGLPPRWWSHPLRCDCVQQVRKRRGWEW